MIEQPQPGNELYNAMIRTITPPEIPDEPVYLAEPVFRKTWFPMFMHYFAGTEEGPAMFWATNVAGNFYKEVHVVENMNNPENTILFTVPPLMSRDDVFNTQDIDISGVLALADLNNQVYPGSGGSLIEKNITSQVKQPTRSLSEVEQWRKIYEFYEVDAPFLHTEEAKQAKIAQGIIPKDADVVEGFDDDF